MALVTLTTTDEKSLRVQSSSVVAVEELGPAFCRVHLSSGAKFHIKGSVATTVTALGL